MALHDFFCSRCGQVLVDVNVPIEIGATAGAPEHCGVPMSWLPAIGRMDLRSDSGTGEFVKFETYDGMNRPVTVDSLHKLRQLERDSEQRARDGEGQQLVWRRYSNDPSNIHTHTLAPNWRGGEQPDPSFVKKHGKAIRRSAAEPDTDYGPGVSDATPSALDSLNRKD